MKLREDIKNIATRYGMREITWEVAENELVVLFQKYADEVIGEDETIEKGLNGGDAIWKEETRRRNDLRAEQREMIRDLNIKTK